MKQLITAIKWDFIRQARYNVILAAGLVTALYILAFLNLPVKDYPRIALFAIFNDPMGLGMLFIGSLLLFERSEHTLQALSVTPLKAWQYVASKAISLTLLATLCSLPMMIAALGWRFHYGYFVVGIALSASLFTFLGLILVSYCKNFNQYILRMAGVLIPVALPLLNFLEITDTPWWYLIPTQASLILLEAAIFKVEAWQLVYAFFYLVLWNVLGFIAAVRVFQKQAIH